MYKKIVIGVDETDQGADALALGQLLASPGQTTLVLVCVFPFEPLTSRIGGDFESLLRADASALLKRARDEIGDRTPVELRPLPNMSPARALHNLASEEDADLIVIGSTHRGALGRIAPGSVGQQLLHGAPCAVSVAPRGFASSGAPQVKTVGVAYNASEEAKHAHRAARQLAAELGASVRLISVVSDTMPVAWGGYGYAFADYLNALRDAAREELDAAAQGSGEDARLYEGFPPAELARATEDLDLLFMGSRAYGPLRGALLGSVSAELLRTSACPVILLARGVEVADSPAERSAPSASV